MINDLRTDLKAPKMKVVVGALGICGFSNRTKWPAKGRDGGFEHCSPICNILEDKIIPAQLAVGNTSKYPEFAGNVAVVETRQYHRDMIASAGKACYHWNNNAQSYWDVGQAMGKAWLQLAP